MPCDKCRADGVWLRSSEPPDFGAGTKRLSIVDLFAGCGGLSFGFAEAARRLGFASDVALAVDSDRHALEVFQANLRVRQALVTAVEAVFDGELSAKPTLSERRVARSTGMPDLLLGGPPCQGNSTLNNKTRGNDPRNELYKRMARAAEVLEPAVLVVENVPSIRRDRRQVITETREALLRAGYDSAEAVVDASVAGVPQRRRRHILIAARDRSVNLDFLTDAPRRCAHERSIAWAIADLETRTGGGVFDSPSKVSEKNQGRIDWLFANQRFDLPNELRPVCHHGEHTYRSMYGRLRWEEPAQTLTTGFSSPGQGRYIHPTRQRTITPHEAARIQTFPDAFVFGDRPRKALARMIGNAVPPLLNVVLGELLIPQLRCDLQRSLMSASKCS